MANLRFLSLLILSIFLPTLPLGLAQDRKAYIVYMGALPNGPYLASTHHTALLQQVLQNSSVSESLIYSYKRSFNGFVAKLTDEEQRKIASMEGVVSVFPRKKYNLLTSRSWDFLGFPEQVKRVPGVESDIIVGVIDTGIWPESESFTDKGLGPPPQKWKGVCQTSGNFTCNNKLIGARVYPGDDLDNSPRDSDGHGTHTSSTAAGRVVDGASFFGLAEGRVRGGVPDARIAMYRVCGPSGCSNDAILAAFDDAIADGVDIISISIGSAVSQDFIEDTIAIGGFHAAANGILTSHSAGNSGPTSRTVSSVAPWLLSVAATSIDRYIVDKVTIGDGSNVTGNTINTFSLNRTEFPLINGEDAGCSFDEGSLCSCLNATLVKGKIVFCNTFVGIAGILDAEAVGAIFLEQIPRDFSRIFPLPAAFVSRKDADLVESYLKSSKNPTGNILKSEAIFDSNAPRVASFSSRGPNTVSSGILKPDISAPGVNILAAYSPVGSITSFDQDKRSTKYTLLSGTSMACPHAAGAAAYVKTFHPDWSPSAIKSALMTTATRLNSSDDTSEFGYGAGNINPVSAIDPGLVYEASKADYIQFLCDHGYNTSSVRRISGDRSSCPDNSNTTESDLNYPSVAFKVRVGDQFAANFSRTVTNVGSPTSTYNAKVTSSDSKIKITISPSVLRFESLNEKKSFVVEVSGERLEERAISSHSLVWSDGSHNVRSPIVVYT